MKILLIILLFITTVCHAQWHIAADEGIWNSKLSAGWYAGYTHKHLSAQIGFNTIERNVFPYLNAGYDVAYSRSLCITPFAGLGIKPYKFVAGMRASYKRLLLQWMNTKRLSAGYIYTFR